MVRRGLTPSHLLAAEAVAAGLVLVGGAPALNSGRLVDPGENIRLIRRPRFVSRGGEKLDAALGSFDVQVAGERAVDVGSSTGGFTDCLLQRGAREVTCVDVGRDQLRDVLRRDPRVHVLERTNVRSLPPGALGPGIGLVTADLSFVSLRLVAAALVGLFTRPGSLVVLIKPQFECDRAAVSRGRGVIRDVDQWRESLRRVISALGTEGAVLDDLMVSPLRGADGNVEFLGHFRVAGDGGRGAADSSVSATRPLEGEPGHPSPGQFASRDDSRVEQLVASAVGQAARLPPGSVVPDDEGGRPVEGGRTVEGGDR